MFYRAGFAMAKPFRLDYPSWRDYDLVRRKLPNRGDIHFIIPFHNYFVRDLADVLGQVVDEAVIVVEDEDFHSRSPCA